MVIGEHRVGLDDLRAVRAALIAEEACVLLDEAAAIAAVAQLDPGPGGGEGGAAVPGLDDLGDGARAPGAAGVLADADGGAEDVKPDRKSTRLNSSHVAISYAVFCLRKKI